MSCHLLAFASAEPDLIMCRKQPGIGEPTNLLCQRSCDPRVSRSSYTMVLQRHLCPSLAAIGKLCEKCDGKCVICDSYVRPTTIVHICDECNYGSSAGRCVICGHVGASDAFYCKECTQQEKDVRLNCCWPRVRAHASLALTACSRSPTSLSCLLSTCHCRETDVRKSSI